MPQTINLVCTRCPDHNRAALLRWYNDHAQLLMASPELQRAELFCLPRPTETIDYFCLYHFAQISNFAAFDSGEVMSKVREMSNAAQGRGSIEITQRTQYERLLNRRWSVEPGGDTQASLFTLQSASMIEASRWLNDVLYALHLKHPLQSAQVYASATAGKPELFALLQAAGSGPLPPNWHAVDSPYAPRPNMQLIWQAQAEPIAQWLR